MSYCRLGRNISSVLSIIAKKMQGGAECILICDDEEWKTSAAVRYLNGFNIKVVKKIKRSEESLIRSFVNNTENNLIVSVCGNFFFSFSSNKIYRFIQRTITERRDYQNASRLSKEIIAIDFPYWRKRREELYLYAQRNIENLDILWNSLADDQSREALEEVFRCAVENDVYRKAEGWQEDKYWDCYKHIPNEVWVNCGSAAGDTVLKYISKGFSYDKIYAFEGSKSEFVKLSKILLAKDNPKIELCNEYIGLNSSAENFDNRFFNIPVSLINMDIEGAEMGVLNGCQGIIRKWRPVIAVCAYHKVTDLLDIPTLIRNVADDYYIFFRKYKGYEPNALNEFLYYAVPKERCL